MANVVHNKLTVYGPGNDLELLKEEIKEEGKFEGGYQDYEVILYLIKDLER
jgi:hypothetical protein